MGGAAHAILPLPHCAGGAARPLSLAPPDHIQPQDSSLSLLCTTNPPPASLFFPGLLA